MSLLGLLFDSGFDVVAGFISWFKKIEEQVLTFLDLNLCNFLFLIFFYLIKINLDADVVFLIPK